MWGILPLGVTNKNRASSCTQDRLREKITQKLLHFEGKKKVEIVIFRTYVVTCHVISMYVKVSIGFFEAFDTFGHALAKDLIDLLNKYDLRK